ncbi:MAG: hypothetical protein ACOH1Y_11710 [Propionicimonas sp.]
MEKTGNGGGGGMPAKNTKTDRPSHLQPTPSTGSGGVNPSKAANNDHANNDHANNDHHDSFTGHGGKGNKSSSVSAISRTAESTKDRSNKGHSDKGHSDKQTQHATSAPAVKNDDQQPPLTVQPSPAEPALNVEKTGNGGSGGMPAKNTKTDRPSHLQPAPSTGSGGVSPSKAAHNDRSHHDSSTGPGGKGNKSHSREDHSSKDHSRKD